MTSKITRFNYNLHWLQENLIITKKDSRFNKFKLEEKNNTRDLIKKSLAKAILDHHTEPEEIKALTELLGYKILGKALSKRLPSKYIKTKKGKMKKNTVRIGNFGEVVAAEHLCQSHDYLMPVFKLRYDTSLLIALPGEDVIHFKISPKGEVKTLKSYRSDKVTEAYDRLLKAYSTDPVTLNFISRILIKERNHLGKQIMGIVEKIGLKDFPTENWIFIITGNKPRDPFKCISELSIDLENLNVVSLYLPNLPNFIDEIFDLATHAHTGV